MNKTVLMASCAVAALFSSQAARGDWTGFYVGVHAGGILGDIDITSVQEPGYFSHDVGETLTHSPEGVLGGGQLGFDFQSGNWLVGLEVSGSGLDLDETEPFIATEFSSVEVEWMLTASARLGVLWGDLLLYLKGGWASADVNFFYSDFAAGTTGHYESSETHNGFVVGAGLEHELGEHVSFGVEYNYIDLGNQDHTAIESDGGTTVINDIDGVLHSVTARLNFHWNPL